MSAALAWASAAMGRLCSSRMPPARGKPSPRSSRPRSGPSRTTAFGRARCIDTPIALAQIEGRTVKAIAVLTRGRSASLPALASAHEQGLTGFEASNWCGFFLPKGTPAAIVRRLHDATVATMNTAEVQAQLQRIGATVVAPERRSSDYLRSFVASEIERWAGPIRASGVSLN